MELKESGMMTSVQASCTWKIEDLYKFSDCKPGEVIKSPNFTTRTLNSREKRWNFFLHLSGDCEENKDYVSIYAETQGNICDEKEFRISILNNEKKEACGITFYERMSSSKGCVRWGSSRFIHKNVLRDVTDQSNDNLTILFELVVSYVGTETALHYQEKKLHTDIGTLLESGHFSDLTITVSGEHFKTHKNILAVRSTTFAQWFNEDAINLEKDIRKINKLIVSPKTFKQILQFIYTEKIEFLACEAQELLRAATIFGLDALKYQCEEVLSKNLTVSNVIKIHILANTLGVERLKENSMNFIILNAREILDEPDYEIIVRSYPCLLKEIYEQTILRR